MELIDTTLPDPEIEKNLDATLHKSLDITETGLTNDVADVFDSPCPFFACRENEIYQKIQTTLVKSLSWGLQEHKVEPGSLLVFTFKDSVIPVLLGVVLKKPVTHTLMSVSLDDQQLSLPNCEGNLEFQSSHQLLFSLLKDHATTLKDDVAISVAVWHCNAYLASHDDRPGSHVLKSDAHELHCTFEISTRRKAKKKQVVVKLPFGMEQRMKDQRKKNKTRKIGKIKAKKTRSTTKSKGSLASNSDSSSSSSFHEENDLSDSEKDVDQEEDEESVVPMSSVVEQEQRTAQKVALEVEETDEQRSGVAKTLCAHIAAGKYQSSFFAKECGLDQGSIATSGRAVCLKCKTTIAKDAVRFSWFHSKIKPPGWVHCHCLYQFVKETGLEQRALQQLERIIKEGHKNPHVFNPVVVEADKILKALK